LEQGLQQTLRRLRPEVLPEAVREMIQPKADPKGGPVLDLMVVAPDRNLEGSTLTSILAMALQSAANTPELRADAGRQPGVPARRQSDPAYALAVLREWGQVELDHGDKAAAERRWGQMLDLLLPPPMAPKRATPGQPAPAAEAPANPSGVATGGSGGEGESVLGTVSSVRERNSCSSALAGVVLSV